MKRIQDPVHGYITISGELVDRFVDSTHFQRLRNLRQLDTTRQVYPSAGHSRFEHTLGVFHLGKKAFENLRSGDDFTKLSGDTLDEMEWTLKCACLFHDLGHFPFSHLGEEFADEGNIDRRLGEFELRDELEDAGVAGKLDEADPHEKMSCLIVLSEYGDEIRSLDESLAVDIDIHEICAFILGTSKRATEMWQWEVVAELLHSPIDVDRLDYMIRDDFMAGASLVSIDSNRMVNAYTTADEGLALSERAHSTIGNYLDGRNAVYMWITQHHKVVYTNVVIEELIAETLDAQRDTEGRAAFSVDQILEYGIDDPYVIEQIRSTALGDDLEYLERLFSRYRQRDYLSSCWKHNVDFERKVESDRIQGKLYRYIDDNRRTAEAHLCEELDIEREDVFAGTSYVPGYDQHELDRIFIDHGGTAQKITNLEIYEERGLYDSIPYIFVPDGRVSDVIDFVNENPPPW